MAEDYRLKARLSRYITVASYFALLALFVLWHFVLVPVPDANPLTIVLVKSALLLAFLPTIISGNPRNHAWLCFVLMPYFMVAVIDASIPGTFAVGTASCILIGILFTSAMMYARWQSRYNKQLHNQ